jgi:hypothetical protein
MNDQQQEIYEGRYSSVSVGDLNNDSIPDLVLGNYRGGIRIFYGNHENTSNIWPIIPNETANFIIYPNPVSIELNVQCATCNVQCVEIFDITGKLHSTLHFDYGTTKINIVDLKSGIYFLRIDGNIVKFVKK